MCIYIRNTFAIAKCDRSVLIAKRLTSPDSRGEIEPFCENAKEWNRTANMGTVVKTTKRFGLDSVPHIRFAYSWCERWKCDSLWFTFWLKSIGIKCEQEWETRWAFPLPTTLKFEAELAHTLFKRVCCATNLSATKRMCYPGIVFVQTFNGHERWERKKSHTYTQMNRMWKSIRIVSLIQ